MSVSGASLEPCWPFVISRRGAANFASRPARLPAKYRALLPYASTGRLESSPRAAEVTRLSRGRITVVSSTFRDWPEATYYVVLSRLPESWFPNSPQTAQASATYETFRGTDLRWC